MRYFAYLSSGEGLTREGGPAIVMVPPSRSRGGVAAKTEPVSLRIMRGRIQSGVLFDYMNAMPVIVQFPSRPFAETDLVGGSELQKLKRGASEPQVNAAQCFRWPKAMGKK